MKFHYITLDRKEVKGTIGSTDHMRVKSGLHLEARSIIQKELPLAQIFEEVPVHLMYRQRPVFFDFYIPINSTFIEVQGQQHKEYVKHFHGSKRGFLLALARDQKKKEWADLNNFKIIEFNFNEKDQWKQILIAKR